MSIFLLLVTVLCASAHATGKADQNNKKRSASDSGWTGLQSLENYSLNLPWGSSQNLLPTVQSAPQLPLSGPYLGGWKTGSAASVQAPPAKEFQGYAINPPAKHAQEQLIIEKPVEKLVPITVERIVHKPYPVPIPIPQSIPVAVEHAIPIPVKTPIAIPVHHPFPIPVKHAVPVPIPIPVPVPVHDHYGLGISGLSGGLGQGGASPGGFGLGGISPGGFGLGGISPGGFGQGGLGQNGWAQSGWGQSGWGPNNLGSSGQGGYNPTIYNQALPNIGATNNGAYGVGYKRKRSKDD